MEHKSKVYKYYKRKMPLRETIIKTTNLNKTKELIIIRESILGSWLKDIITFGVLSIMYYINYQYLDSNWFVYLVATLFVLLIMANRTRKNIKFLTPEEAIKYLEENKEYE